jgi:putative ABC transport system ATP-binding protein
MELILSLNKERGTTIIIVTHDPRIAARTEHVILCARRYAGRG